MKKMLKPSYKYNNTAPFLWPAHTFSFYFESCCKRSLSLLTWWLKRSALSPSSDVASNSWARWWKYNIRRMSGQWKWKIKAYWPLKDFRNGTTGYLVSGKWIFFFLLLLFFPHMITMCKGWIWVRRQFMFVMDTRTGKLSAWFTEGRKTDLINVILEPGGRTMAKRTGLLFPLLYFMAEFWLTSQQVLRIGECHFSCFPLKNAQTAPFLVFAFTLANPLHNLDWTIMFFVFQRRTRSMTLMIYSGGCCFSACIIH